jgi:hypothetical protein
MMVMRIAMTPSLKASSLLLESFSSTAMGASAVVSIVLSFSHNFRVSGVFHGQEIRHPDNQNKFENTPQYR